MKKLLKYLIVLLVMLFLAIIIPLSWERGYHCDYTGSTKSWTAWPLGFQTDYQYRTSKLEYFVETKFPSELNHKWVSYAGTGRNIFGQTVIYAHGSPNPLFYISGSALDRWCASKSDTELKQVYDLMIHGERDKIQRRAHEIQLEFEASLYK